MVPFVSYPPHSAFGRAIKIIYIIQSRHAPGQRQLKYRHARSVWISGDYDPDHSSIAGSYRSNAMTILYPERPKIFRKMTYGQSNS
jgi:hypothetical protein